MGTNSQFSFLSAGAAWFQLLAYLCTSSSLLVTNL